MGYNNYGACTFCNDRIIVYQVAIEQESSEQTDTAILCCERASFLHTLSRVIPIVYNHTC